MRHLDPTTSKANKMIENINILAAGKNGDMINLLIFVGLIGISIVGGWLQKRAERKAEQNQDAQVAQRRNKDRDLRESIARKRSQRIDTGRPEERARQRREPAMMRRQQIGPAPVKIQGPAQAETPAAQAGRARPERKTPPQAPVGIAVGASPGLLETGVMDHLEHPICDLKPEPPRAPTAPLGQLSVQTNSIYASKPSRVRNQVRLSGKAMARQAIIFHEVFSSPKALRTEREIWD